MNGLGSISARSTELTKYEIRSASADLGLSIYRLALIGRRSSKILLALEGALLQLFRPNRVLASLLPWALFLRENMPTATINVSLAVMGAMTVAGSAYTVAELKKATAPYRTYSSFCGWALSVLFWRRLAGWWVPFSKGYRERYEYDPRKGEYKAHKPTIDDVTTVIITTVLYALVWAWYANIGEYIYQDQDAITTLGIAFICFLVIVRTLLKATRDVRSERAKKRYGTLTEGSISTFESLGAQKGSQRAESARALAIQEAQMKHTRMTAEAQRSDLLREARIVSGLAASFRKTINTKEKSDALLKKRKAELDRVWGKNN
jgi:hypothetical protein